MCLWPFSITNAGNLWEYNLLHGLLFPHLLFQFNGFFRGGNHLSGGCKILIQLKALLPEEDRLTVVPQGVGAQSGQIELLNFVSESHSSEISQVEGEGENNAVHRFELGGQIQGIIDSYGEFFHFQIGSHRDSRFSQFQEKTALKGEKIGHGQIHTHGIADRFGIFPVQIEGVSHIHRKHKRLNGRVGQAPRQLGGQGVGIGDKFGSQIFHRYAQTEIFLPGRVEFQKVETGQHSHVSHKGQSRLVFGQLFGNPAVGRLAVHTEGKSRIVVVVQKVIGQVKGQYRF